MDTVYEKKNECTGCGLCKYVCPNNAIVMKYDNEGFAYPSIDKNSCINCEMCTNMCPNVVFNTDKKAPDVYAVKHKRDDIRNESTSGGIFTALSDFFLEKGGVVCGCILDEDHKAVHIMACCSDERNLMRDSKYVQSDICDIYEQINNSLNEGRMVLFTGTPCQAEAVRKGMEKNKNSDNLYICDFVCHGVPSPRIFRDYIKYLEQKSSAKIKRIKFREKVLGWSKENKRELLYETDNGVNSDDTYYKLYFNYNVISRPCCEKCKFTEVNKRIDFTIGDFWGIEKHHKTFDDGNGVSLLILHNSRAKDLFCCIAEKLDYVKSDIRNAVTDNPRLVTPTVFGNFRKQIFDDYYKRGYGFIVKQYVKPTVVRRIIRKLKKCLKRTT